MVQLNNFSGQNWLITPAVPLVGPLNQPRNFLNQSWLLVLTGVVEANLQGNGAQDWLNETVDFIPGGLFYTNQYDHPPVGEGPLYWALNEHGIPRPGTSGYSVCFSLQQWAPFVSLSSIFDRNQSINAGFAVDRWRPKHFWKGFDLTANHDVGNLFTGVTADVAVRDTDAFILKFSYSITLLGKIVFGVRFHD